MMAPKSRPLTAEDEERMITPQMLEQGREILLQYSRVFKALAKH